jgi:hypothetical protein
MPLESPIDGTDIDGSFFVDVAAPQCVINAAIKGTACRIFGTISVLPC